MQSASKGMAGLGESRRLDHRFFALILAGLIVAVVFGPEGPLGGFWRPAEGSEEPSGLMIPGFIGVLVVEGLALGTSLAVLVFGRAWFTGLVGNSGLATAGWLSTIWLLGSWWPHTAAHRFVGDDLGALLAIEWTFHVGSMVAMVMVLAVIASGSRRDLAPVD